MYRRIRIAKDQRAPRADAIVIALFEKTTRVPAGFSTLNKNVAGALSTALRHVGLLLTVGRNLFPGGNLFPLAKGVINGI